MDALPSVLQIAARYTDFNQLDTAKSLATDQQKQVIR